ncbi:TetR/AcrR family transcriptional regulator C-terminal domain-containing protein [Ruminococcus sp.]|uniref:TetR/AcrR family transcriptional regulator n=1 Tax=Ruminococcus sp. TaxID=41978 RepID=UPI00388E2535
MSKLTQKAIQNSFVKLLDSKPIDRITIKDITDDCGISRNTFYYHYADLPALVEELLTDNAEELMKAYPSIDSLEECLNVGAKYVLEMRRAANHIYHSSHRDIYERCLMNVLRRIVAEYFEIALPVSDFNEEEREILIDYYKCVCFGIIADWCNNGMREDYAETFRKLLTIRSRMLGMEFGSKFDQSS